MVACVHACARVCNGSFTTVFKNEMHPKAIMPVSPFAVRDVSHTPLYSVNKHAPSFFAQS
uniref:Uncharacterized protein n=1 Tax=Anguilla anguilla TaxID=7936 RepID=A0A0E9TS54_ANGAN